MFNSVKFLGSCVGVSESFFSFFFFFQGSLCDGQKRWNGQNTDIFFLLFSFFSSDWLSFCLELLYETELVKREVHERYICVSSYCYQSSKKKKSLSGYITLIVTWIWCSIKDFFIHLLLLLLLLSFIVIITLCFMCSNLVILVIMLWIIITF